MISKLIRISGLFNIFGAILLLVSWVSIGVFMWDELSSQNFTGLVLNPAWIPINIAVLISTFFILLGLVGLYLRQAEKSGWWGLAGFILTLISIAYYTCIQYYETILWPAIAAHSPKLFQAIGFTPTNTLFYIAFMLSGLFWALGFIILGVTTTRSGFFPKWAGILFTVGAVVFGLGMVPMIRSIGALLFCIGLTRLGFVLWREKA